MRSAISSACSCSSFQIIDVACRIGSTVRWRTDARERHRLSCRYRVGSEPLVTQPLMLMKRADPAVYHAKVGGGDRRQSLAAGMGARGRRTRSRAATAADRRPSLEAP